MPTFGRYQLLRAIGRGGMGELFLARRCVAGVEKRLVIKRIRAERAADPAFLELFMREAQLSMRLAHQNIVPVFDFGRVGDEVFLAMEHVDGIDLGAARDRGRLAPLVAAFIAAECCQALVYAHQRGRDLDGDGKPGVVHCDVTPRNVLLSRSGEVKLVDFGVAVVGGKDGPRGTPSYMAPEQARGEPVDARADVYALGLVLREMLTGVRARAGRDARTQLAQARSGQLPALPAAIDPWLAIIVERATAADPGDRYPDARTVLDALDAFMVAARASRPGEPAPARLLEHWLGGVIGVAGDAGDDHVDPEPEVAAHGERVDATARSLAETAAAEPSAAPPPAAPGRRPARRRAMGVAITAALAAAVVTVLWTARSGDDGGPPPIAALPTPLLQAGVPAVPATATTATAPTAVPRPAPAATVPTPRPNDATRRPERRAARTAAAAAARAPATSPPPAPVRRVTVGATPWANFRVDDTATVHETPMTVELAPGRHVLHFENRELDVRRDVEILVPEDRDLRHVESLSPR